MSYIIGLGIIMLIILLGIIIKYFIINYAIKHHECINNKCKSKNMKVYHSHKTILLYCCDCTTNQRT